MKMNTMTRMAVACAVALASAISFAADIVFDCPHCGHNLCIDYRGAGLQITCSECGEAVLVPIPDGMKIDDLDLDPGEILKQLFATRRNLQRAEARAEALEAKLADAAEKIAAVQELLKG